jgi:hypothetical protein
MDLICTSQGDNKLSWFKNNGTGNFGPRIVIGILSGAEGAFAADLDGDGDLDLVASAKLGDLVVWFENLGGGTFSTETIVSSAVNNPRDVLAADLDNDGDLDIVSASSIDDKIAWYENNGFGEFGAQQIISTQENGAFRVEAADIDGDGDTDIISLAQFDGVVAWFENDGAGVFGPRQIVKDNTIESKGVSVADFNGDGYPDLVVRFAQSGEGEQLLWFENDGSGAFTEHEMETTTTYANSWGINVADFDGDGDIDVLSTSAGISKLSWYENTSGPGSVTPVCQNITVGLYGGSASVTIDPTDVDGGTTADAGIASLSIDINSFDSSNIGANEVTLTVTDNNGNTAQCTATVTVIECLGDFNGDLTVNTADLIAFVSEYGCSSNCSLDLNGDNEVGTADFIIFLSVYGQSCN